MATPKLDDCWIRLGILAHIKSGQKLSNIFSIQHPSFFTTLLRYFSSESRRATMETIEALIDASISLCPDDSLEGQLAAAVGGLRQLQETYESDQLVVQHLEYFVHKIHAFLGTEAQTEERDQV